MIKYKEKIESQWDSNYNMSTSIILEGSTKTIQLNWKYSNNMH